MKRHGSLNHIYRLVWSSPRSAWIAVAETTRGRGKTSCRKLIAAVLSLSANATIAEPLGGQVIAGAGTIAQSGVTTTVTQSSQTLSLNWQSFNIAAAETVNFVQPSAAALAVNRILDPNGTQILGRLDANGQVYLINPNGILFGQGAQVNVGGLVASALDLNDKSIDGSARSFSGTGTGSVVNQGTIDVANGSYVALLGNHVSNQGTISAHQGAVALGAGSAATLTFSDNSLVRMQVDQSVLSSVADNGGLIRADGGLVVMNAGAKDALLASVVNNTGVIEARTVENRDGTIVLLGGMAAGTVNVGGTLDASAPNGGNGGFIETSAAKVKIANDAKVTTAAALGLTGTWLIDPVDFTIAATGGDTTGAAVSASLGSSNVEIRSSTGDVNVNDTVAWSSNTLELDASNNININAAMNGSGTAALALQYGQGTVAAGNLSKVIVHAAVNLPAGPNFSMLLGSDAAIKNFTVITALGVQGSTTATDLQGMSGGLGDNYALGADINATDTSGWNVGKGFTPVGTFTGTFDGLGHTISGLTINRPFEATVGLFGITSPSAAISNVGLVGGRVTGSAYTGGLVGLHYGLISDSHSSAVVAGGFSVGGLVGWNYGVIDNSDATGAVSGSTYVGGLVGRSYAGIITNAHATGAVTGTAIGIGGLVGRADISGTVANSYATGAVSAPNSQYVGGLVGYLDATTIDTSYSIGAVSGSVAVGGLVGFSGNSGTVSNSYWNIDTSGRASSAGGTGLTAIDMQVAANFVGFNFTTTPGAAGNNWVLVNNDGTLNNADDATGSTYPMLAAEYSTNIRNAHQLQLMSMAPAASYTLAVNVDAASTANSTDVWRSEGFVPVGTESSGFTGTFDGQGRTVSDLGINRPSTDSVALFSVIGVAAVVQNVGLVDGASSGRNFTGLLVGGNGGTINNSYATGTVSGTGIYTGGLVGFNLGGVISNSHAAVDVSGETAPGGLVGLNAGMIIDSFATGTVSGSAGVGGLVGANYGDPGNAAAGMISGSYAIGSVSGATYVGGLVGFSIAGAIDNSSSASNVGGDVHVGGLVGFNAGNGTISDSSASGVVSGTDSVGGLVGSNAGPISSSHASGIVTGKNHSGGLVGNNIGAISDSYATGAVSGDVASGGLVGTTADGTISNSYATGNTSGTGRVGGLAGYGYGATITTSYATGSVSGSIYVGGLVGEAEDVTIDHSYATGTVSSSGGLAGGLVASNHYGSINDSHATGSVTSGGSEVGGLVGFSYGSISNSYATGQVTAAGDLVGGLVGNHLNGAAISISYATGHVSGADKVGGLVGYAYGAVSNSYASGNVAGNSDVGGLIGYDYNTPIDNSYAMGLATGGSNVGGLIGFNASGVVSHSFWNTANAVGVNGVTTTGATGLDSVQLQTGANFTSATAANGGVDPAWDFADTWILYEGHTAPLLRVFMTPLTATAGSTSKTYDGTAFTGGNGVTFSSVPDGNLFNATGFTGSSQGARNVGSYVIASDAYSHQQGYAITFVNGTLTVDPAALTQYRQRHQDLRRRDYSGRHGSGDQRYAVRP